MRSKTPAVVVARLRLADRRVAQVERLAQAA
jgi:hypothetical protein